MPSYLRLHVEIENIEPRIWRTMLLPRTASFLDLHQAIQDCGWTESHLWEFLDSSGECIAGDPEALEDPDEAADVDDAGLVVLTEHFKTPGDRCTYVYDLGDGWEHRVTLEGFEEHPKSFRRRLLDGARSFPPEDCGGVDGYLRLVEFLSTGRDPWDEDDEELKEWIGAWRPDAFTLATAKAAFERPARRRRDDRELEADW